VYVANGISQKAYVGWYIDFRNMHGTNNVKFSAYSLSSLFSHFLIKQNTCDKI